MGVRRSTVDVDVAAVAPAGCTRIAADIFAPQDVGPRPLLWVCIPGGGMSRQYFDLDVAGQGGAFSMARHLAAGGDLVVTVDPPGVGRSEGVIDGTTGIRLRPPWSPTSWPLRSRRCRRRFGATQ